jgi:hypothetical protein
VKLSIVDALVTIMGCDHTFTIEFLDPGVQAFSFTFGLWRCPPDDAKKL